MRHRTAVGTLAAVLMSGGILMGSAGNAAADTCPNSRNVYIPGGESHYTLTCSGGRIYVDGRVKDTRSDGLCVRVKALMNGVWHYSNRACPAGETEYFSWNEPGSSASVYTYTE